MKKCKNVHHKQNSYFIGYKERKLQKYFSSIIEYAETQGLKYVSFLPYPFSTICFPLSLRWYNKKNIKNQIDMLSSKKSEECYFCFRHNLDYIILEWVSFKNNS